VGGFDEAWTPGIIGERLTDLPNGDLEHGIADKCVLPDCTDQVLFGDELSRARNKVFEDRECLGPELDRARAPPETLVHQVERERSEMDAMVVRHEWWCVTETLPRRYDWAQGLRYCPLLMDGWQSKAAFVVQFRDDTDVSAGRLNGKVEHIASFRAARFHSVDELFAFIALVLAEIDDSKQL
jgi:hypothetical protein